MHIRWLLVLFLISFSITAYCQQDVDFHLSAHLLSGKKVLKVKRDFHDPYLWALTANNGVYRINSITLAVDDYTSSFAAYNNFQFTDIAGRSQDTVFVATNSTDVIEYKKGIFRTIGPPDGLAGTINEVGMDYVFQSFGKNSANTMDGLVLLMVATTTNVYCFDCVNEVVIPTGQTPANNHLFETTYRTEDYSDTGFISDYYPDKEYTVVNTIIHDPYTGFIWHNIPEFGNNIYTAYYTIGSYDNSFNNVVYLDQYWGTENGLFQNNWNSSYSLTTPYRHYLNGIKVNKVTSIYGLTAFGSDNGSGLTKENLLAGTDKGFYYSSSGYLKLLPNYLRDYNTFTFDTDIGNQVINDVCVNATSYTKPVCENAVWVAASDGLYCLKPDYGAYIASQQYKAISFEGQPDNLSTINVCSGTSITALINSGAYSGVDYQWFKDGKALPTQSKSSLLITTAGDYYAVLYDPCSTLHLESNHLQVTIISSPVFSFNYPDKLQLCNTISTVLKTNNNPQYSYRWYTNGVLNGATDYQLMVTQSGKYKVEVSACTNSWVPSKEIEVDLINLPVPAVTADKPKYCAGDIATLTVNTQVDPGYHINWYQDGNLITADQDKTSIQVTTDGNYTVTLNSTVGPCTQTSAPQQMAFTPAPVFTFNYPDELRYCTGTPITLIATGSAAYGYRWYKDGALSGDVAPSLSITQTGKYKVEVSSCDGSWVPSKEVQVDLINIPVPVITTDKPAYCIGDNATLSIAIPVDPGYMINWYRDNVLLTADVNQTSMTTNVAGSYMVTVTNFQPNTDGSTCSQNSNAQSLIFDRPPTASIQKIVKTTLCDGQTVDLKVTYNTGTVMWSTGQSSDQITVRSSGSYTASVTTAAGCSVDQAIDVTFFPNPVLNIPNAGVCVPSHKTATLIAPTGLTSYTWNGQSGTNTFTSDHPQTVTLTVTDANGCQATQEIQVNDECPDVKIPNAFTPNGDGINDTWDIIGLEYDQTVTVRIFTRYGQQVFQSKGYGTPWNGEYQGKRLPVGAYYYIINTKNGTQTYSGEVTIIY